MRSNYVALRNSCRGKNKLCHRVLVKTAPVRTPDFRYIIIFTPSSAQPTYNIRISSPAPLTNRPLRRHPRVRPARVDPLQPLPLQPPHRLEPRHPALRHGQYSIYLDKAAISVISVISIISIISAGLRRYPLREGRPDLLRRAHLPPLRLRGVPGNNHSQIAQIFFSFGSNIF